MVSYLYTPCVNDFFPSTKEGSIVANNAILSGDDVGGLLTGNFRTSVQADLSAEGFPTNLASSL